MKTLIFNGSPRNQGNTAKIIELVTENLLGEYKTVNAYDCDISACIDCRYCWENNGCSINDEMQEVYDYIQECDNILIASPIYFSELTGKLLDIGSRLQTYYCAKNFRKEEPINKLKKGAVVLVGGGDGSADKPYETASILLKHMNCRNIYEAVVYHNTNEKLAIEDEKTLINIHKIIKYFNEEN